MIITSLQHFDFMAHLEYVVELSHVHNALALTNLTLHDRKLSPPPSTTHLWRDDRRIVLLQCSAVAAAAAAATGRVSSLSFPLPARTLSASSAANGATGARWVGALF